LNLWMVRKGWAVAYKLCARGYVGDEGDARRVGRDIWSGSLILPWEWPLRGLHAMRPQADSPTEVLAGFVERVTYHNQENGFCVLQVKARSHREW
jgi:hypothetical protein